ncbi:MAG: hypothetical protein L0G94_00655 [Brachybacterium sp.]|uniref:hypothetical protein n=1 Tax=Brachybacterium sp. TaxID=1891286 RepID=UPI002649EE6C|nr:hypothetical protein [Brachybacterium sp.]MDN5685179.1 hypothetical protein [Brachybacterium sp.]
MNSVTAAAPRPAIAPSRKHTVKAVIVGKEAPAIVVVIEVSTIAITAPATVVPIERISAFTPTPAPASDAGEFSMTSVGMAA